MSLRPTLEVAYEILRTNEKALTFIEIWNRVAEHQKYTEEQKTVLISRFYTNLMLDGRFINLGDNTYQIRDRVRYDEVSISLKDVYSDIDEEEEEEVEEELFIDKEKHLKDELLDDEEGADFEKPEKV